MSENEELKEEVLNGETADEDVKPCAPPEPAVSGNQHIEIISHNLLIKEGDDVKGSGVVLNLKNNAGKEIGKAVSAPFCMMPKVISSILSKRALKTSIKTAYAASAFHTPTPKPTSKAMP